VDAEAARGAGGVMGTTRGAVEVGEADNDEATRVGWSDHQPLFPGRSNRLGVRSNHQPLF
jgi:hypothetical protein